jgi:hypothetical protein
MHSTDTFVVDWPVTGEGRPITPHMAPMMSGRGVNRRRGEPCVLPQDDTALLGNARSEAAPVQGLLLESPTALLAMVGRGNQDNVGFAC